jgi:uncharacterized small protein (DUF1192 family)
MRETPVLQYVSKKTFDEVWNELQSYKAGRPDRIAIVSFEQAYEVGSLHDRIRELEAEVETLKALLEDKGK